MLTELFSGSTDFTEAVFKIPGISKHFSAMLRVSGKKTVFENADFRSCDIAPDIS